MLDLVAMLSLKIGEPCVVSTPATSVRSLIGTGSPASRPRSPTGFFISWSAWLRARSKQSVGSALTWPSTSAIRASRASSRSCGVMSPCRNRSTMSQAVARTSSLDATNSPPVYSASWAANITGGIVMARRNWTISASLNSGHVSAARMLTARRRLRHQRRRRTAPSARP